MPAGSFNPGSCPWSCLLIRLLVERRWWRSSWFRLLAITGARRCVQIDRGKFNWFSYRAL
jgi:hypothetical protein